METEQIERCSVGTQEWEERETEVCSNPAQSISALNALRDPSKTVPEENAELQQELPGAHFENHVLR